MPYTRLRLDRTGEITSLKWESLSRPTTHMVLSTTNQILELDQVAKTIMSRWLLENKYQRLPPAHRKLENIEKLQQRIQALLPRGRPFKPPYHITMGTFIGCKQQRQAFYNSMPTKPILGLHFQSIAIEYENYTDHPTPHYTACYSNFTHGTDTRMRCAVMVSQPNA